jgi:DNA-binding NtrC family response regulator
MNDGIVFVDDDEVNALLAEVWLSNAGFTNVSYFREPEKALRYIERNPKPALVISDYNMPTMNGVDFLQEVKKNSPEIKTIIVSATSRLQWHPIQPHKVLVKGVDYLDDLVREIKKELGI